MTRLAEGFLFGLFAIVRVACLMQGFALLATLLGAPVVGQASSGWLQTTLDGLLRAGAVLFVTGLALFLARRHRLPTEAGTLVPKAVWPLALAASLVLLPVLAWLRSGDLALLWNQVSGLLGEAGFFEELERGGQGSGLIMLPILVALLVPILETVVVFFLVVVPPILLVPLAARSPRFPSLFSMLAATQTGLAVCSFAVAATLASLVGEVMTSMNASGDAEVIRAAEIAAQLLGLVDSTARGFVLPVLGHLVWVPFLLLTAAARRHFAPSAPDPSA